MRRLMGRSLKSCVEIVEGVLGAQAAGRLPRGHAGRHLQAFRDAPLQPVPGRGGGSRGAAGGRPETCVASSGALEKMRFTLGLTGLWALLRGPDLQRSSQVPRGKPFPDLFLHAASSMDEQPVRCVVVEDSVPGIQAARAAGMRALAYAGAPTPIALRLRAAGGQLFDDMRLLPMLRDAMTGSWSMGGTASPTSASSSSAPAWRGWSRRACCTIQRLFRHRARSTRPVGRPRLDGRLLGAPVDLGGSWVHGVDGNPLTAVVRRSSASSWSESRATAC